MATVLSYFTDTSVVTLYGTSGFGKTHLAKHIGQSMKALGYSVLYVRVQDFLDTDEVKAELKKITRVLPNTSLRDWAETLPRKTLVILDNVDGRFWSESKPRAHLKQYLIDILTQYSELKVLTTSQEALSEEYQSYRLGSLTTADCIHLFKELVKGVECSSAESVVHEGFVTDTYTGAICRLVGNTPLVIDILAKTFMCSDTTNLQRRSVDQLFKDIVRRSRNRRDPFGPFKIAFEYISEECRHYSLLLYKFQGSFTVEDSKLLGSSDMLGTGNEDNYTVQSVCLLELSEKSFIEKRLNSYSFHVLVRVFLNSSLQQYNMTTAQRAFWENYFSWQYHHKPDAWKPVDVYNTDIETFARILDSIQIAHVFAAYNTLFTVRVRRHLDLDLLMSFEQRAKQLHLLAIGNSEVTFNRSVFHNRNVERECKLTQNSHAICHDRWQFRLLDLMLQTKKRPNNSSMAVLLLSMALNHYALMDIRTAIPYLELALKHSRHTTFGELYSTIVYITLYSSHIKLNNTQMAKSTLARIQTLYRKCSQLTCYTPAYGYLVIPFFRSVNETDMHCGGAVQSMVGELPQISSYLLL